MRRCLFLLLPALLVLSPLAAERAAALEERTAPAGVEDSAAAGALPAPGKLTEQDALSLARELVGQGRREEAAALYQTLIARGRVPEYRVEAAFQLAGIRMLEGRYREAALLYLGILNHRPDLPRVRLELARAYFMDRDYENAQAQFELVKGGELPAEVLEKVDLFLALIRRQKNWSFDFNLALVPDSNLNQASGGREECISVGGALLCRPLEEKQSGVGLSLGGAFEHYWRFSRDFGLRSTIGLNALEHEGRDFDDYQLSLAVGPRRTSTAAR